MARRKNNTAITTADHRFGQAVQMHVEYMENAIATITTSEDAIKAIGQTNGMYDYAKKIKANTSVINSLIYAKLLACAQYGALNPADSKSKAGAKGGRGKKAGSLGELAFAKAAMANYRKLAKNLDDIKPYYELVEKINRDHGGDLLLTIGDALVYVRKGDEQIRETMIAKLEKDTNNSAKKLYTGNYEWYTPPEYIEAVRIVLGQIDVDPASSREANKFVKAKKYYTEKTDGLTKPWKGRVFMNPPYGRGIITEFCDAFLEERDQGNIIAGIVLTNSCTGTSWWQSLAARCRLICFTKGRIKFRTPDGANDHNPVESQSFFYFGDNFKLFAKEFAPFGLCFPPV